MSKVDEALKLLDQVIEKSSIDDKIESNENSDIALDGDGWITHHLKLVRKMLKENLNAKN